MKKILITCNEVTIKGTLNESLSAAIISDSLPFEARANRWGNEIYFEIPCSIESAADARDILEVGELGYWPTGHAFCIFFGRTPVSTDEQPRAASKVNVFGKLHGDVSLLRSIKQGSLIKVVPDDTSSGA